VPDAWIDTAKRDPKDGQVGLVGYEINFNRYFYRYTPPRPLEETTRAGQDQLSPKRGRVAHVDRW
jgi:hypothetical protein